MEARATTMSVASPQPRPSPTPPHQHYKQQQEQLQQLPPDGKDLKRRLEKLSRHYDVDTMKVFMVVEALGEGSLHAVYSPERKGKWDTFLKRQEACRLDLAKHEKTRERYHQFLNEVGREEQGRQWFHAVMQTLHNLGAVDVFNYISNHTNTNHNNKHNSNNHSPRRHESLRHPAITFRQRDTNRYHHHHHPLVDIKITETSLGPPDLSPPGNNFCQHLIKLFEKKLETWFEDFHAIAVRLTAHVKVSGLVRVLSGQVHALCTRQGRLTAVAVKVTAQETPRPLDVAELCLVKIMMIQNGLVLPEDLDLALLTLHMHPVRPVLRLWLLNPSIEMQTAIRMADIDDMIDAGRLTYNHELWLDNTTTDVVVSALDGDNANSDLNGKS